MIEMCGLSGWTMDNWNSYIENNFESILRSESISVTCKRSLIKNLFRYNLQFGNFVSLIHNFFYFSFNFETGWQKHFSLQSSASSFCCLLLRVSCLQACFRFFVTISLSQSSLIKETKHAWKWRCRH